MAVSAGYRFMAWNGLVYFLQVDKLKPFKLVESHETGLTVEDLTR